MTQQGLFLFIAQLRFYILPQANVELGARTEVPTIEKGLIRESGCRILA